MLQLPYEKQGPVGGYPLRLDTIGMLFLLLLPFRFIPQKFAVMPREMAEKEGFISIHTAKICDNARKFGGEGGTYFYPYRKNLR